MPISVEPPASAAKLRRRLGVAFDLYSDPGGKAARAWGVYDPKLEIALAATFVVDRSGQIVYRYLGSSKVDRPSVDAILAGAKTTHHR